MIDLKKSFLIKVNYELLSNESKGKWEDWQPFPYDWFLETQYHIFKLLKAFKDSNEQLILEHSCDLFLYAEKSYTSFINNIKKDRNELRLNINFLNDINSSLNKFLDFELWNPYYNEWMWRVNIILSDLQKAIESNNINEIKAKTVELAIYSYKSHLMASK